MPWLVAGGLAWTACQTTRSIPESVFQSILESDRMDVITPSRQVKTIVRRWRIRKIAQFLARYSDGWQKPWSGAPIPEFIFDFHKKSVILATFGVGRSYLTAGNNQDLSRALTEKERGDLLKLLAVEEVDSVYGK